MLRTFAKMFLKKFGSSPILVAYMVSDCSGVGLILGECRDEYSLKSLRNVARSQ